jgi:hypothetical protein
MAELTALQSVPDGQIGSGTAQVFNPMQGVQILQNAIQRQDQLDWHNKQEKLRRQQMEAAARAKAAEDEVVAKYEENKGELFAKYGREVRDSLINAGQKSWSNFKSPQKKQFIADVDDVTKGVNVWSLAQDEKLKQLRANPDNKYFNIPSSLVQQEADDFVKRNPNFYKGDFVSELDKKVRSNPSLYNWGVAGDDLMKDVKTFDGEINTASGTGSKVKFSQIYQSRKNPKTGILEPILDPETGLPLIDKDVVMQKINSNPTIREMTNNFIAQALPQLQQQFPNLKTDELLKAAEGEAINKMFRARGVYDVSKDLESTQQRARSTAKGTELAGLSLGSEPASVDFTFTPKSNLVKRITDASGKVVKEIEEPTGTQTGKINFGNVSTFSTKSAGIPIGANRRVIMLSDPQAAEEANLIKKNPNGGYNLNIGGDIRSGQIVDVHVFSKNVANKRGGYTVEKLTPIDDAVYARMSPKRRKQITKTIKAYRVSPTLNTSQMDEDTEQILYKNPKVGVLDVLIPIEQAGDITTALKRDYSKPETFNPFD